MTRRRPIDLSDQTLSTTFEVLRSDYNAAKTSRYRRTRTGVNSVGNNADYHYRTEANYLRMMELARDFARNDMVVGQGIRRVVDNVVNEGFRVKPQTTDEEVDAELAAAWRTWSENPDRCDTAGELDFHAMEQLALRSVIIDGDIFGLLTTQGSIQWAESHRCRTPKNTTKNVVHGVMLDQNRRRLEYWFTKDDIDPLRTISRVSDMRQVPARDSNGRRLVLHLYRPERFSQTRGVTHLAPIADAVGMHDDVQFAKLVQQQVVSCFAILAEQSSNTSLAIPDTGTQLGSRSTTTLDDGTSRTLEGVAPGAIYRGRPGEILKGFSPNVPNAEFFDHATLILTFIAINLDLPLAVLLLDPRQTNFSGWRGAIDQARLSFRRIQRFLVSRMHRPIYQWRVLRHIEENPAGRVAQAYAAGLDVFAHRWHLPSWRYIEPMKDATANLVRSRNAQTSQRRIAAEQSLDWDELTQEIVDDHALLISRAHEKAKELNTKYDGLGITWRELACLPTPDGVQVSIQPDQQQQQTRSESDDD